MLETLSKSVPVALPSAPLPSTGRRGRPGLLSSVANIGLYQLGWLGCVIAAGAGRPTWAIVAALTPALIHLGLVSDRRREIEVLLLAGLVGLVIDTITVQAGILDFPARLGPSGIAPLWIVALWMQFGMTLHFCFGWLSRRYWLSAALGAVGGPLSFLAGARLGAVEIMEPVGSSLALLGLLWGVAMPSLVAAGDRLAPRSGDPGLYRFELENTDSPVAVSRLEGYDNR